VLVENMQGGEREKGESKGASEQQLLE
jgi:hypothetical protein